MDLNAAELHLQAGLGFRLQGRTSSGQFSKFDCSNMQTSASDAGPKANSASRGDLSSGAGY